VRNKIESIVEGKIANFTALLIFGIKDVTSHHRRHSLKTFPSVVPCCFIFVYSICFKRVCFARKAVGIQQHQTVDLEYSVTVKADHAKLTDKSASLALLVSPL
jgi:hypothetical protein